MHFFPVIYPAILNQVMRNIFTFRRKIIVSFSSPLQSLESISFVKSTKYFKSTYFDLQFPSFFNFKQISFP